MSDDNSKIKKKEMQSHVFLFFFVLVVSILRRKFSTNSSLWWTSLNLCEVNDIGASYHLIYVIFYSFHYFLQKALMETGSEWSQNKKVVNVTRKDGVAKAVSIKQKLFMNKIMLKWYRLTISNSKLMFQSGLKLKTWSLWSGWILIVVMS